MAVVSEKTGEWNLEIAHRTRPKPGESKNGDAVIVRADKGITLFGVVDALGHGPRAAEVASRARLFLEQVELSRGILFVLTGLHDALQGTRGAAAMCAIVDGSALEYGGVGNVEMRCEGSRLEMGLADGILGQRVRRFRTCRATLEKDFRLALYSDGISGRFSLSNYTGRTPEEACDGILERFARPLDDASLLLVDFSAPEGIHPGQKSPF